MGKHRMDMFFYSVAEILQKTVYLFGFGFNSKPQTKRYARLADRNVRNF